ncbi:hypothetical protein R1sor_012539 [Riccia sorocarpa]|uniref:CCHC-type domain-containing protein n=1 Tax=Riccia sorocarpa TaxID=122646 RepID=A0ABD3I421_9MARC
MATTNLPEAEKLNGAANYSTWAWKVQSILEREDLWHLIEGKNDAPVLETQPDGSTIDKNKKIRQKALSILKLSITDNLIPHLGSTKGPYACWSTLEKKFNTKNKTKLLILQARFSQLKMAPNQSVASFMREVKDLLNHLEEYKSMKATPSDELAIAQVLNALPKYLREKNAGRLNTKTSSCHRCGLLGHWSKDCHTDLDRLCKKGKEKDKAFAVEEHTSDNICTMFMSPADDEAIFADAIAALALEDGDDSWGSALALEADHNTWVVDSGATTHVASNSALLTSI